jgi:hypothetical protein
VSLKVKAIIVNSASADLQQSVMGWSLSGDTFISSGHRIIRDVLNAIKDGVCVSHAKRIIESSGLVSHEGGHCVAHKRAKKCGTDLTLFSTQSSGLYSSTSTSKCTSVVQCCLETGYSLVTIVLGAALDPVTLWVSRMKFPEAKRVLLHSLCRWCGV